MELPSLGVVGPLYMTAPGQLQITGLQTLGADPSIDEAVLFLDEVRKAVARLRGGKVQGFATFEAMTCGLHTYSWHVITPHFILQT